jgi:hypothetical protein
MERGDARKGGGGKGREDSSFSEEKEAKRLFEALRGGCERPSWDATSAGSASHH